MRHFDCTALREGCSLVPATQKVWIGTRSDTVVCALQMHSLIVIARLGSALHAVSHAL